MNYKEMLKEFIIITVATAIVTCAVYFFLVPSHVSVGSVSGLAIVLERLLPLKISMITLILNVVLLVFGFITIGKEFGAKTVYTSILSPAILGVLEEIYPNNVSIMGEPALDMVCYVFLASIGMALLFKMNASSGGLDIIAKFMNKYFRIELGKGMSMAGMCVALSSALVFEKNIVVLSVLGTYLKGLVLDHFIFGFNVKKKICIISKKEEEIKDFILNTLHCGATIYESIGAYDNKPRREINTIVNKSEYAQLLKFIAKTDKTAFITVYTVNELISKSVKQ